MMIIPAEAHIDDAGTAKGRGVLAGRNYEEDEMVERCPVIIMEQPFDSMPEGLRTFAFNWGVLTKTHKAFAIALGLGSMYNHDNPSNMRYEAESGERILVFTTVRPVIRGEELTINYNALGGGPIWDNDHWFESNKIKPITGPDGQ
jgi:hypothetical protein